MTPTNGAAPSGIPAPIRTSGSGAAPAGPVAGGIHWQTGAEPALVVRMLSTQDAQSSIAPYAYMTGTSTLRDAAGKVVATSDEPGRAND
jgi:hypothetical protein